MLSLLQHARIAGVCLEARSPLQAHLKMFVGGEGLIYADPPARLKTQLNCERWVERAQKGIVRHAAKRLSQYFIAGPADDPVPGLIQNAAQRLVASHDPAFAVHQCKAVTDRF